MIHSGYSFDLIEHRYQEVQNRVEKIARDAGRNPADVRIIAVSKTHPAHAVSIALAAGIRDFGENYVQELQEKINELRAQASVQPSWHFIGHLQTNKVKYIAKDVALIHSVDSSALAREINKQAEKAERILPVLLQVNTSGEESKFGCSPDVLFRLAEEAVQFPSIHVQGLMTLAAYSDNPEDARPMFHQLSALREQLQKHLGTAAELTELSMGMSGDYQTAIEEGATMIRIGTAIFGERDYSL